MAINKLMLSRLRWTRILATFLLLSQMLLSWVTVIWRHLGDLIHNIVFLSYYTVVCMTVVSMVWFLSLRPVLQDYHPRPVQEAAIRLWTEQQVKQRRKREALAFLSEPDLKRGRRPASNHTDQQTSEDSKPCSPSKGSFKHAGGQLLHKGDDHSLACKDLSRPPSEDSMGNRQHSRCSGPHYKSVKFGKVKSLECRNEGFTEQPSASKGSVVTTVDNGDGVEESGCRVDQSGGTGERFEGTHDCIRNAMKSGGLGTLKRGSQDSISVRDVDLSIQGGECGQESGRPSIENKPRISGSIDRARPDTYESGAALWALSKPTVPGTKNDTGS